MKVKILPHFLLCLQRSLPFQWSASPAHGAQFPLNSACFAANRLSFHTGLNLFAVVSFLSSKPCNCYTLWKFSHFLKSVGKNQRLIKSNAMHELCIHRSTAVTSSQFLEQIIGKIRNIRRGLEISEVLPVGHTQILTIAFSKPIKNELAVPPLFC